MENRKKNTIFLTVTVLSIAFLGFMGGVMVQKLKTDSSVVQFDNSFLGALYDYNDAPRRNNATTVLTYIEEMYVDSLDMDTLSEKIIPLILNELDPHSVFIPASEAVVSQESLQGNFDGIGVVFNMLTDTVIIQEVISGGPSSKVGIITGDRIIRINDTIVAGRDIINTNIVSRLKGKGGTTVKLGIKREGVDSLIDIPVIRGKVVIKSIDAAFMMEPKIGYIKLLRFSRNSYVELTDAILSLKSEGMETLILDLQHNGGGFLDQAILIANEFLLEGKMIVYTEGRGERLSEQYSNGRGRLIGDNIVVLVNEGSASASEIVAGALQDNDIGTIVGRRTFGKGLVQQQICLTDGSLLNLTIARYHTPTGRSIQRPYDMGNEEYEMDIVNRYLHGEFVNQDSIKMDDSLKYVTPKGKVVYGGGGIMPDIFVPADTVSYTQFEKLALSGIHRLRYAGEYVDRNRRSLEKIETKQELDRYFHANMNKIISGYKHYFANNEKEKGEVSEWKSIDKDLRTLFRATIGDASQLRRNALYMYMSDYDEIIKAGVERAREFQSVSQSPN